MKRDTLAYYAVPPHDAPVVPYRLPDGRVCASWFTRDARVEGCLFCRAGACVQRVIRLPEWTPDNEVGDIIAHADPRHVEEFS